MLIASEPTIDLPLVNRSRRQKLDLFYHLRDALGFGWDQWLSPRQISRRMEPDAAIVVAILDGRINPAKRDRILKQR